MTAAVSAASPASARLPVSIVCVLVRDRAILAGRRVPVVVDVLVIQKLGENVEIVVCQGLGEALRERARWMLI